MSDAIEAALNRLDEMNDGGEISYEAYRELHDLVSTIPAEAAPEPEWEYGVQATVNLDGTPNARIEPASEKELPHLRESQRRGWCTIYHRRKDGPWEVVADAE